MDERKVIGLIVSSVVVREAWLMLPENYDTICPFLFSDVQITLMTYFAYMVHYFSLMLLSYAFMFYVKQFHIVVKVWFILQTIEFFDYLLTYNEAWFHLAGIGIGITLIKFVSLTSLTIYKICRT